LSLVAGRWSRGTWHLSLVAWQWSLVAGRWSRGSGRLSLVAGRWSRGAWQKKALLLLYIFFSSIADFDVKTRTKSSIVFYYPILSNFVQFCKILHSKKTTY
jgi:hypothetical protein